MVEEKTKEVKVENIEVIGNNKDIVLTVIHDKVNKFRTGPAVYYANNEINILDIAKEINRKTGVTILVNRTNIDLNSENEFIDNSGLTREFKDKIDKIKPNVILDLHGMADKGILFNNAVNNGTRIFREFFEKPAEGDRPDVDIEVRRKASVDSMTSRGTTVKILIKNLALSGLITDVEAVYPGGLFISNMANKDRDLIAIEIAHRVRTSEVNKQKFIAGIINFIKEIRGEGIEPNTVSFDVDEEVRKNIESSTFYVSPEGVDRYVG